MTLTNIIRRFLQFLSYKFSYCFALAFFSIFGSWFAAGYGFFFIYNKLKPVSQEHINTVFITLLIGLLGATFAHYILFGMFTRLGLRSPFKLVNNLNNFILKFWKQDIADISEVELLMDSLIKIPKINMFTTMVLSILVVICFIIVEYSYSHSINNLFTSLSGGAIAVFINSVFTFILTEYITGEYRKEVKKFVYFNSIIKEKDEPVVMSITTKFIFLILIIIISLLTETYFITGNNASFILSFLFILLTFFTISVLVLLYLNSIHSAFKEIVIASQELSQGGDGRVFFSNVDKEFSDLAKSFNKSAKEVVEVRANLEVMVNQRTQELNDVNQKLRKRMIELNTMNVKNLLLQIIIKQYTPKSTWVRADLQAEQGNIDIPEEEMILTLMFADILNFTGLSEKLEPKEVIEILNAVFSEASKIIYENNGDIDKFIGDAFFAVFESPDSAVKSAIQIQSHCCKINKNRQDKIKLRIGINTGKVIRGNVGGEERKDNTIIGDAVNLAQRLESACEPGKILISENTYNLLKNKTGVVNTLHLNLKGREKIVKAFLIDVTNES